MSEEKKSLFGGYTTLDKFATSAVLFTGLLLTGVAYKFVADSHQQRLTNSFEQHASDTTTGLASTLIRHTNLLAGLQGLFHASDYTSRLQFERYVRSLQSERNHPEAAAFSWNASVPFDKASAFEKSVRVDTSLVEEGNPDFQIKPPIKEGNEGIVVTYVVPMKGNEAAFGFDISSNPARRIAAHKARDTGEVVITEPIVLTQDSDSTQKAFLMFLPTYSTATVTDKLSRRQAYNGQVAVVTRAARLVESNGVPDVNFFQVLDNTAGQKTSAQERVLYSLGAPLTDDDFLHTERTVAIGGRTWLLTFQRSLSGQPRTHRAVEIVVLGLGGLASLLASLLVGSLATSKHKAEKHAEKLTVDLQIANEELLRSNDDLSQFAHVASHDLQTPVRNVISAVTLLESHLGDSKDPAVQELFGLLTSSSNRMRALVTDLLDYARLGRDAINFEPVDLNAVLEEVRLATHEQCEETDAQLHIKPLPRIVGDARQLIRVFENLIINSIKYAHPDRNAVITISESEGRSDCVHIQITDNGQGIESKYRDAVFIPFKRLHRHDDIAGSGLGLGICKQIIERHGGTITIEESSKDGTIFQLALPVQEHENLTV